jgi:HD superfamily phosphohydrolase
MEIRDPVHGSIRILDEEIPVIENRFFQRLRNIKQLGLVESVFPGATHSRFLHSIGVMNVAERAFDSLFRNTPHGTELLRLRQTLKLAALLHDIGHAPLSHSTETVMPKLKELHLPERFLGKAPGNRRANHEHYTTKIITDSSFSASLEKVEKKFGVCRSNIAELIIGKTTDPAYFTLNGVNHFPLLHQLISSEMDCDRMDYLHRDSYFCGVSYGHFDLDWLLDNLLVANLEGTAFLGLSERAVSTFDDFLIGRFHMFLMVYFHYKAVCMEQILLKYFATSDGEYSIPADIEAYLEHDDYYLNKVLRSSQNRYAKDIVTKNIPAKIFESFNPEQEKKLNHVRQFLALSDIEHIYCSSEGRLSKYYDTDVQHPDYPIKIVRSLASSLGITCTNINEATDLFQRYSKTHAVSRLHCRLGDLTPTQKDRIHEIIGS